VGGYEADVAGTLSGDVEVLLRHDATADTAAGEGAGAEDGDTEGGSMSYS